MPAVRTPQAPDRPAPLSVYRGTVRHARLRPVRHAFAYSMSSILIDIDRLAQAGAAARLFSVNRANLLAFHERDHGPRDGSPLRPWVDRLLAAAGCEPASCVELLCYPTVLGYTFNPLSVYFCRDAERQTVALIYQVHNTFGQSHAYVEPVVDTQRSARVIAQRRDKQFYVSPFMEMGLTYHFRVCPPDSDVSVRIRQTGPAGPVFLASFDGNRQRAGDMALLATILQTFAIPWKVIAAIHFEALRLWWKGLKVQPRPPAPAPFSIPEFREEFGRELPAAGQTARGGTCRGERSNARR